MTTVTGTDAGESLSGTSGNDQISALGGDDQITVSAGVDTVDGGDGVDLLRVSAPLTTDPRSYTVTANRVFDGSGLIDTTFTNVERVSISDLFGHNVTLDASGFAGTSFQVGVFEGTHTLTGSATSDIIGVTLGSATVDGGAGIDRLRMKFDTFREAPVVVTRSGDVIHFDLAGSQSITARNVEVLNITGGGRGLFADASQIDVAVEFSGSPLEDVVVGGSAGDSFSNFDVGDVIAGLGGADTFFSTLAYLDGITILDLDSSDRINLDNPAIQTATFIGSSDFTGVQGEYRYYTWRGETFLEADLNGDGHGDNLLTIANGAFTLGETALGSNILQITGVVPTPDPGPNTINCTAGANVIESGAGNDTVNGLDGNDRIDGGADNDTLDGGAGDDQLFGMGGDDLLVSGIGSDTLIGGTGNDTYTVDNTGDVIVEGFGGGLDTVFSSISYTLTDDVERLGVNGFTTTYAIDLTGNAYANEMWGNDGANVIDGRTGADIMTGFGGNDFYIVDNAGDVIIEGFGGGLDTVFTSISYTLSDDIERLGVNGFTTTYAIDLTGNAYANEMWGNDGANVIDGRTGADIMTGFGGNDFYIVDNAGDVIIEGFGGGFDTVFTSIGYTLSDDIERLGVNGAGTTYAVDLIGNARANEISGNDGANMIAGQGGSDILIGYGGADTFAFTSSIYLGSVDLILDFQVGVDKIGLDDGEFAGLSFGTLAAGAFYAGTAAHDIDDRIIYDSTSGALYFDADGSGAGAAVQFAALSNGLLLTANDFQVI